jgi:hypothetical protein
MNNRAAMNWFFLTGSRPLWLSCLCAAITVLAGCATHTTPARNVAYDPYVPSALLTHRAGRMVSVAYVGTPLSVRHVARQEGADKEVMIFDE